VRRTGLPPAIECDRSRRRIHLIRTRHNGCVIRGRCTDERRQRQALGARRAPVEVFALRQAPESEVMAGRDAGDIPVPHSSGSDIQVCSYLAGATEVGDQLSHIRLSSLVHCDATPWLSMSRSLQQTVCNVSRGTSCMSGTARGATILLMANATRPAEVIEQTAARLRLIRTLLGLEQVEIAEASGISSQRWSNWEQGLHLPDVLVMARTAQVYGVSLDWIYRGSLERLPYEFVEEIRKRRPDLILGASSDAAPADGWDKPALPWRERRRRSATS
jgi:transcriptional regulator with XRE-family HTH domain